VFLPLLPLSCLSFLDPGFVPWKCLKQGLRRSSFFFLVRKFLYFFFPFSPFPPRRDASLGCDRTVFPFLPPFPDGPPFSFSSSTRLRGRDFLLRQVKIFFLFLFFSPRNRNGLHGVRFFFPPLLPPRSESEGFAHARGERKVFFFFPFWDKISSSFLLLRSRRICLQMDF